MFRHKVSSFDDLLKDAREAENVIAERQNNDGVKPKTSGSVRCAFCHRKGHKVEDCFKKKHVEDEGRRNAISTARENTSKPKLACYCCNPPGVVRANCPNCKSKKDGTNDQNVAYFNMICSDLVQSEIHLVNIKFFGCLVRVIIDTGARMSVASANMKEIMDCNGCTFHSLRMDISLADGSRSVQECLATTCKMEIGRKTVDIQFVVLPNARHNRTLLGTDFLEKAGIVLNMGQKYWYFEEEPEVHYLFAEPLPLHLNLIESIKVVKKIASPNAIHAARIQAQKRKMVEQSPDRSMQSSSRYISDFEYFGPDIGGSDYSPHSIQAIFKDSLPLNERDTPERPRSSKRAMLTSKPATNTTPSQKDYCDAIFTPLYMVDFKILKESDVKEIADKERLQLDNLLVKHINVFGEIVEPTPYIEHRINTGNHAPISSAAYRLSFMKAKELRAEIFKMMELGIVEECESACTVN